MTIRVFNPLVPAARLRGEMDRLFGDLAANLPWLGATGAATFPALNIWEDEQHVYAEAELPGMQMDDLEVLVVGNELTIKGERKAVEEGEAVYHRRERGLGAFSRVIRLPVEIDADKEEAHLQDGVLSVKLPKAEAARPRKIEVKCVTK